ncbi:serine protease grass-like [Drosophila eugracilis]|uniref:serine protease grass-like n=1 Tax=Drosophila eugracilis TaxID=29029 RepID=UPI001BD9CC11|nr:serine protease grass-like [Drosophila eugracilis]
MNPAVCFAILTWVLIHQGSAQLMDENCGRVTHYKGEVITDSPWMALVVMPNKSCSGALIHRQFVITSATCVLNHGQATVRLGDFKSLQLRNISNHYPLSTYIVQTIFINKLYDRSNYNHDIALLKLKEEVLYKAHIRPICIWLNNRNPTELKELREFKTTRWDLNQNISDPEIKKIPHLNPIECENALNISTKSSQICAGYKNDSICEEPGSPLIWKILYFKKRRSGLLGVQSYGVSGTCLYTDIMSYIDWILGIVFDVEIIV